MTQLVRVRPERKKKIEVCGGSKMRADKPESVRKPIVFDLVLYMLYSIFKSYNL